MKISVIGLGYVGLSNALLISQKYPVVAVDNDLNRLEKIRAGVSPFIDKEIELFLSRSIPLLTVTSDKSMAYADADYVVIATPTNYDEQTNRFDTSTVDTVISEVLSTEFRGTIVIKSTIPVGYTDKKRSELGYDGILFSPEFLREGKALYDNLYPSRIIVGDQTKAAEKFGSILKECALKDDVVSLMTNSTEAEAIKLFSNTYLAMRIAFFNELDTYAMTHGLSSTQIVEGVGLDPRIGLHYNNPSFGYGGYCLPKDTKQMLANFENIPNNIIKAIVDANNTRKECIASTILSRTSSDEVIGVYKLAMKQGSDNFRSSAIIEVMTMIRDAGRRVVIFEPTLKTDEFMGIEIEPDLRHFKMRSSLILANRRDLALEDVYEKVFTRDLFGQDL